ncbi:MAG TPA: hypothetical protein VHA77_12595 [Xanthobacteraceae bacterium]|nr:hypothetical protein [Xanthobacteraceae bacterium]
MPMRFEWVHEGPEADCAGHCRYWIAATGAVTKWTRQAFDVVIHTHDVRGATIVLDSNGGSVGDALTLGRAFRRLGLTTTVGKTIKLPSDGGEERATLSPNAYCASVCVYLLLGGLHRHVPDEARLFVHQVWPATKRTDALTANYPAAMLVGMQRVLGKLARYTVEMGVDIELFELSTHVPPWEAMRPLTRDELRRFRVQTDDSAFGESAPRLNADGALPAAPAAQSPAALKP